MKKILESFCVECAVLAASRGARSIFIVGILFYSLLYPGAGLCRSEVGRYGGGHRSPEGL